MLRLRAPLPILWASLVLLVWASAGCGRRADSAAPDEPLLVAVAANFLPAFSELAERFRADTGAELEIVSGATGRLYAQIRAGAPFDLFFAADRRRPELLERQGHAVPGSRRVYARGRLALTGRALPAGADGRSVLRAGGFTRLAIADPDSAPYGHAAIATLRTLGLLEELRPALVYGENVAQSLQFAVSGAADLAFVALSQVVTGDQAAAHWVVPVELSGVVEQECIALRRAAGRDDARALLDFVHSAAAAELLSRHGYVGAE